MIFDASPFSFYISFSNISKISELRFAVSLSSPRASVVKNLKAVKKGCGGAR